MARPPAIEIQQLDFHPLTPERWPDLEALFGPRGACAGCWCMWWRLKRADFEQFKGQGNKHLFQAAVETDEQPGILAYADGHVAGWCAIAPREVYPRFEQSRVLKVVDAQPVWSVTCFFVARPYRRQGVTARLLEAAVTFAIARSAQIIEGYPVEPKAEKTADAFAYTGLASTFRQVGFVEVARRSPSRPIMRYFPSIT
ncbi:MAG: GNAT family N-acetyltransferase [Ktedonobacterales bacterium]